MDVYDQEIARLVDATGEELEYLWDCPTDDSDDIPSVARSVLFQFCTPTGRQYFHEQNCGCLIQVRWNEGMVAATPSLTRAIRADNRIPEDIEAISNDWDSLPVKARIALLQPFAEWQRRLDIEIRGKQPATPVVKSSEPAAV
jgi:hypothetical protein